MLVPPTLAAILSLSGGATPPSPYTGHKYFTTDDRLSDGWTLGLNSISGSASGTVADGHWKMSSGTTAFSTVQQGISSPLYTSAIGKGIRAKVSDNYSGSNLTQRNFYLQISDEFNTLFKTLACGKNTGTDDYQFAVGGVPVLTLTGVSEFWLDASMESGTSLSMKVWNHDLTSLLYSGSHALALGIGNPIRFLAAGLAGNSSYSLDSVIAIAQIDYSQ